MRIYVLLALLFTAVFSNAQPSLIAAAGFSTDVNTKPGSLVKFTHIPVSLQCSPFGFSKRFLPIVKVDYLVPFSKSTSDYAYSLNPALPPEVRVQKTIKPLLFNINAGMRFRIYQFHNKNTFYTDALLTALAYQNIKVTYSNYDKVNYEIINPDVSLSRTSFAVSMGLVYRYSLNDKNSILCMLHIQSPPFASPKNKGYELSYRLAAPLQLTIGYSFSYKKIKKYNENKG